MRASHFFSDKIIHENDQQDNNTYSGSFSQQLPSTHANNNITVSYASGSGMKLQSKSPYVSGG